MPAPQPGNQSDNAAGMIWGVAAVFAAIGGIWFAFKSYIIHFYLTIKLYELDFLNLLSPHRFDDLRNNITTALASPAQLGFNDLVNLGMEVGEWLRWPFIVLLLVLAVIVYLGNTTRVFKRNYNMQELAKFEKENWPQINPVVGLNLLKTDIDTGPWAMAMTPMQFCKRHRLLEEIKPQRREGLSRKSWNRIEVILKRGEANKIFALQLGALWKGTAQLPEHTRALFAAFAARINADTKSAETLLSRLSASSTSGKLDVTGMDDLLKKHENTKLVQGIVTSHAYVHTVMASMLQGARDDGVQASADFLWLKPVDRKLWYTLNTVGRQTPFVEVAGIFAHWVAEKEAGRKLLVPMVEEATNALDIALKEVVYRPDET